MDQQNYQRMQQIQDQLYSVEAQLQEFEKMIRDIEEYSKIEKDSEIFAPISHGIFVKAKAVDTDKFTVNVGSNTVVEKNKNDAIDMLKMQITELQKYRDELILILEKGE